MKNFERPEIIDTFENAEGVYLASGRTPYDPKDPKNPEITYYFDVNNHDGGSHSDCSFKIGCPAGTYTFKIEVHLNNQAVSINDVWLNSEGGRASGTKVTKKPYGFFFRTTISHPNSFESTQFSIGMTFTGGGKADGSYMERQGNPTFPVAEAQEIFTFYTNI